MQRLVGPKEWVELPVEWHPWKLRQLALLVFLLSVFQKMKNHKKWKINIASALGNSRIETNKGGKIHIFLIPQFQSNSAGMATASWSDARRTYVIAMEHGEQDLKRLLL